MKTVFGVVSLLAAIAGIALMTLAQLGGSTLWPALIFWMIAFVAAHAEAIAVAEKYRALAEGEGKPVASEGLEP
ncbi:hypothetical protein [Geopseudomonas aromaticivorans]